MAQLYPHARDGHQVTYYVYFPDGSRVRKYKTAKVKQDAIIIKADCDELEALSERGRLTPDQITYAVHRKYITPDEAAKLGKGQVCIAPERATWKHMEAAYLRHVMKVGSESTRQIYPYVARAILRHFDGIAPISIRESDIDAFIVQRRKSGISKATINKQLSCLRIMFDYLVGIHAIDRNPARSIKDFQDVTERLPRALYPEELRAFFSALQKERTELRGYFRHLCLTYLYTGMRRAELLRLKKSDVSLEAGTIRVEKTKNNRERIIEIHPELKPILKEVVELNGPHKGRYFFGGQNHPLCQDKTITRAFSRFAAGGTGKQIKRILPEGVTLHSLRHTFITYLLKSGCDLKTVQAIAGHKKITTTHRYLHLIPGSENVSKIEFFTGDSQGRDENS